MIKQFIAECVCAGIELYARKYRFAMRGLIEVRPMDAQQFEAHLNRVFQGNKERVDSYLDEKDPTTVPQWKQQTK